MKKMLLIAAGALMALPAYAQTTGSGSSTTTTTRETTTITNEQAGKVRTYIQRENVPSVTVREQVTVGGTLPGSVELRSFPTDVGVSEYRYTVINGRTYLVEPGTRRVVRVIE